MNHKQWGIVVGSVASLMAVVASQHRLIPVGPLELWGVLAGAWGVWLTAEESVWNWPVNIAGSLCFAVLFLQARLFGATGMQLLYAALGGMGWYWWLRGGDNHSALPISSLSTRSVILLGTAVLAGTPLCHGYLRHIHDAAPWGDALALALSLAAQYLVTKKKIEHWHLSIAADLVNILLFFSQGIDLLAVLMVGHVGMCVFGYSQWRQTLASDDQEDVSEPAVLV